MDQHTAAGQLTPGGTARDAAGFVTIQYVAAIGLSLVVLTMLANLIVFQYGRGVVRAAVDEGVRTGSRASASAHECEARANDVIADLLGGAMAEGVTIACSSSGGFVTARADVTFAAWLEPVPDWSFAVAATAVAERA